MTDDEKIKLAREAIKNTDWDSYWKKVDRLVYEECERYREARRKSKELLNNTVLK
jgi:hypothetical protein